MAVAALAAAVETAGKISAGTEGIIRGNPDGSPKLSDVNLPKPGESGGGKEIPKSTEFPDVVKNSALEPNTESALNKSLSSLIEENKGKEEFREDKNSESNDGKEGKEGLTEEQKAKIKEQTGWSDEVIDAIGSWEEAEIYMEAGLKEVEINGRKCLVKDNIDLDQKDEDGITNRERMERGRPPIDKDGNEIELHHVGQKADGPLAELTTEEHRGAGNDGVLHDKTKESEIDRNEFAKERREHWQERVEAMEGGK